MTRYLAIKTSYDINNSNELQIFMSPQATNSISLQDCFIYEFNYMYLNIFVAVSLISHKKIKRYAEEKNHKVPFNNIHQVPIECPWYFKNVRSSCTALTARRFIFALFRMKSARFKKESI